MKKYKVFLLFIIFSLLISFTVPTFDVKAETELEKLDREIQEIEKLQKESAQKSQNIEEQIEDLENQQDELQAEIARITKEITQTEEELFSLEGEISEVTEQAKVAANELDEANNRVEERDDLLKTRVRLMYKTGSVDYIEVLLNSTSFSDFLQRFSGLQTILEADKKILTDNINDKNIIEEKKIEIDNYLVDLESLYSEAEELKASYIAAKEKHRVQVASLDESIEELEDINAEEEEYLIELALAQAKKENQKRILEYGGGFLYWPVPESHRITSEYGYRSDPFTGKWTGHSGIDIGHAPGKATLYGADIVAAADGVVLVSSYVNGYGNCIIIDHGSELWSLYGHIRNGGLMVKVGQMVTMGQKIAEVGSTGRSTGPHLHFEVRLNNSPVSPWDYLE